MKFSKLIFFIIIIASIVGTILFSKITIFSIDSSGEKAYAVFIVLYPVVMAVTFIAIIISMLIKIREHRYYKILFFIEIVYYILFIIIMSSI